MFFLRRAVLASFARSLHVTRESYEETLKKAGVTLGTGPDEELEQPGTTRDALDESQTSTNSGNLPSDPQCGHSSPLHNHYT